MKKIILWLLLMGLLTVMAQEITGEIDTGDIIVKKTAPTEIISGDTLPVTISITNGLSRDIRVTISEQFGGANEVDMGDLKRNIEDDITSAPPYYEGILTIDANSERSITYEIRPLYFGRFKIGATKVYTPMGMIKSNSVTVIVRCNQNGICEIEDDENAITCPKDCSPGERDELCNPLADEICDPDCKAGEDPDCRVITTTTTARATTTVEIPTRWCGNNICEYPGENYGNCPGDCASWGVDGYCDGVKDDICDPDCEVDEDPDCGKPLSIYLLLIIAAVILVVIIIAYKKWLKSGE